MGICTIWTVFQIVLICNVVCPAGSGLAWHPVSGVSAGDLWLALGGTRDHWAYIGLLNDPWDGQIPPNGLKKSPEWLHCSDSS